MRWLVHFNQALVNLSAAKLRSFLAVLGILVGTAAVVALISCGELATAKALEQFKKLGTDLMSVTMYPKQQGGSLSKSFPSIKEWRALNEIVPEIDAVAPYATSYQPSSFKGKPIQGAIIGADETLKQIIKIDLAKGNFVSFLNSFEHYCVIGSGVAQQLRAMTLDSVLGKQIQIGGNLYTIIGIANKWQENGFFNEDINRAIIVPLAGMPLINRDNKINNAVILLKPDTDIELVISDIKNYFARLYPDLNVYTRSAQQIIDSMESQGKIFTLLLSVIGGISLLVGGIGVMNIMLVSVSERRREIGIRKAVGARNRDIQRLFLSEAIMLGLLGGSLGVISGIVLTWIVAWFSQWTFHIFLLPPLAGFLVSAATGIFFGFYPARRAAKLESAVSLRGE